MKMQINKKMLSIPPYISTQWGCIVSIAQNKESEEALDFSLTNEIVISVPNLSKEDQKKIFRTHQEYLTSCQEVSEAQIFTLLSGDSVSPTQVSIPASASFFPLLQHSVEVSGLPEIPKETILKMTQVFDDLTTHQNPFYKAPEPHCQCMYCQIARVVHDEVGSLEGEDNSTKDAVDTTISKGWHVKEYSPDQFEVSSPNASNGPFVVTLSPPSCSCGSASCEHIAAVLYT